MKNTLTKFIKAGLLLLTTAFCGMNAQAQNTFTQTSANDTIDVTPTTLEWYIINPDTYAIGNANLTVFYDGDFGASVEFITIYDEDGNVLGQTVPNADGNDCMLDSTSFSIPASLINTWAADDTIWFSGVTSSDVDYFCTNNHAWVKLDYSWCTSGGTGPFASLSIPVTSFCPSNSPVAITTAPAGGTLAGPGVSGNTFDPSALAAGQYVISYTFTNAGGCTSVDEAVVTIKEGTPVAAVMTDSICAGETTTLTATGNGHLAWYSDEALTMPIGTGDTITTPALASTDTFYVATTLMDDYFVITSLSDQNSANVDHDVLTGDDKGGIAVTMNHVYITGDNGTARFDLDLANGVELPEVDGLFSDLATGQLYTLYNPLTGIPSDIDSMYVTHLYGLTDSLTIDSSVVITLADSIHFGYSAGGDYSAIFAGHGNVIVYSSENSEYNVIDLTDGTVTVIGGAAPQLYGSENWADWGVAEFDGTSYSVLYHSGMWNNVIARHDLVTGVVDTAFTFSDLSDLASFTYAPWNNRWYMHYEGSGQFGGSSETLVYASASDSTGAETTGTAINCPAMVVVNVDLCTDIKENTVASAGLYPNPNSGVFTLTTSGIDNAIVNVISVDGRIVYTDRMASGQVVKEIDLSALANGVYYVRVSNSETVSTVKLIKH